MNAMGKGKVHTARRPWALGLRGKGEVAAISVSLLVAEVMHNIPVCRVLFSAT